MPWGGQTWLRFTTETTYGTYNSGGTVLYPTLYGGNSFGMRKVPQRKVIRTADGGNRRKFVVANRKVYSGRLNTLLHPDQASYWLGLATTLTSNQLGSVTIDYWDSVQAWRFLGAMVSGLSITASAQQDYSTLSLDFVAQQRDATFTTFAQPAETNYSTVLPYQYVETAGNVKLGGSAITNYRTMSVSLRNVLAATWDELPYISACYYAGRDLDFSLGPQYLATAYRGDFENQTALTWILNFTRASPAHALTLTCETNNYISNIGDDLPLDGPSYQNLDVQCFYDAANTTDFSFTAT